MDYVGGGDMPVQGRPNACGWERWLHTAKQRPEMFIGQRHRAHLTAACLSPAELVWSRMAFLQPVDTTLTVAPAEYFLEVQGGPLHPVLAEETDWVCVDNLLLAFLDLHPRAGTTAIVEGAPLEARDFHPSHCATPLFLAKGGVLALRTQAGLWLQAFRNGWPVTPKWLETEALHHVALMVAVQLDPHWFTGLPFTIAAVRQAIPDFALAHTRVVPGEPGRVFAGDDPRLCDVNWLRRYLATRAPPSGGCCGQAGADEYRGKSPGN